MSLVNQMLKDLEQRRADLPRGDRLRGLRAAPDGTAAPRQARWPLLLIVAGIAGSSFGWWLAGNDTDILPLAQAAQLQPLPAAHVAPDVASAAPAPEPAAAAEVDAEAAAETEISAPVESATVAALETAPAAARTVKPVTRPAPATIAAAEADTPRASAPVMHKTPRPPGPREQAVLAYNTALQSLARNEQLQAETALRNALDLVPDYTEANEALAALLLQQGRGQDAEAVLAAALELNPQQPRLAMLRARLLAEAGRDADAVAVLQTTQSLGDADYQALLGALQQRLGNDAQAAVAYRQALSGAPRRGVWWLGLGISLERIQQPAAAADAYRNALRDATLDAQVGDYARARIAALGSGQG